MEDNKDVMELKKILEDDSKSRFTRKMKESPFMVAGLLGCVGVVIYGFYGIRRRKIPLSLYLIHMRVGAQGFVVSCVSIGVAIGMFNEYVYPRIFGDKNGKD